MGSMLLLVASFMRWSPAPVLAHEPCCNFGVTSSSDFPGITQMPRRPAGSAQRRPKVYRMQPSRKRWLIPVTERCFFSFRTILPIIRPESGSVHMGAVGIMRSESNSTR